MLAYIGFFQRDGVQPICEVYQRRICKFAIEPTNKKNTCEKMGTIVKFHPLNFTVVTDSLDQQSSVDTNNLMN